MYLMKQVSRKCFIVLQTQLQNKSDFEIIMSFTANQFEMKTMKGSSSFYLIKTFRLQSAYSSQKYPVHIGRRYCLDQY